MRRLVFHLPSIYLDNISFFCMIHLLILQIPLSQCSVGWELCVLLREHNMVAVPKAYLLKNSRLTYCLFQSNSLNVECISHFARFVVGFFP